VYSVSLMLSLTKACSRKSSVTMMEYISARDSCRERCAVLVDSLTSSSREMVELMGCVG